MRLLGGRLTIESTPGSGTLVQVVVPILEKQDEDRLDWDERWHRQRRYAKSLTSDTVCLMRKSL